MTESSLVSNARPRRSEAVWGRSAATMAFFGLCALVMGLLGPVAAPATATTTADESRSDRPLVLEYGHVDMFNLMIQDGEPVLNLKEDVTGNHVIQDPEDVELHVLEEAWTDFPDSESVPEALREQSAYFLPLTADPALIWPGWDSGQLWGSGYEQVDIHITDVEGPGQVFLWSEGNFGGVESLLEDGGYELPGTIRQDFLAHVHANWAFTEPGEYWLTAEAEVHNPETGESARTNEALYLFTVGEYGAEPGPTEPDPTEPGPTEEPTDAPSPTTEPTDGPSDEPTEEPTQDPTGGPTEAPTSEPTTEPTDDPSPTDEPSDDPSATDEPTTDPSDDPAPTEEPSESPDPSDPPADDQMCWADERFETEHVDAFNIRMYEGEPILTLKEDVTGSHVIRDPADVELHVKEDSHTEIPDSEFVPEDVRGRSAYYLPLIQDQNLLWPGWDSQELAGSGYDQVDINISEVEGPGEVYLWGAGSFGDVESLLADGGYELPGVIDQSYLAHVHANWAFTEPGAYYFTVEATVRNSETGEEATTNTAEYLFSVGNDLPEDYRDCRGEQPEPVPTDDDPSEDPNDDADNGNGNSGGGSNGNGNSGNGGSGGASDSGSGGGNGSNGGGSGTGSTGGGSGGGAAPGNPRGGGSGGQGSGAAPVTAQVCLPEDEYNARYGNGGSNGGNAGGGSGSGGGSESGDEGGQDEAIAPPSGDVDYGTEGHFDFGPVYDDGDFRFMIKDDRTAPPVWRDYNEIIFVLDDDAHRPADTLPDDLDFVSGGDDVWMIQQIQEPGVPWLGWNTQHETIVNGPGADGATMTLDSVNGPGEMAVFLNGNFGQLVGEPVFDTVGGPSSYNIPANTHQHGNWVFTEPGTYEVTITLTADGHSDTGVLTFDVGTGASPQANGASYDQLDDGLGIVRVSETIEMDEDQDEGAADNGNDDQEPEEDSGAGTGGDDVPELGAGQGLTPDGQPCNLAQTGVSSQMLTGFGISLLVMGGGTAAVMIARRRNGQTAEPYAAA